LLIYNLREAKDIKYRFYKKIVILAIVLILAETSIISNTNAENKSKEIVTKQLSNTNLDIDWWHTFQHDNNHTGYSTCNAPEIANLLWSYTFSYWGIEDSSPAVVDGKVYFGARDSQKVYCLNTDDGSEIWTYTTGGWVDSSPTVVDGKVFVGSDDEKLYCLDADDGSELWTYTDAECGEIDCSPCVVDIDEDGVYEVFFSSGSIYCLNAETGDIIWKTPDYETRSFPVVTDGDEDGDMEVYLGEAQTWGAYCLLADNGSVEWTSDFGGNTPTVTENKIIVCSDGIHCLDITNGSEIWSCLGSVDMSAFSVALWDDKIYASGDKLYCRDIIDGSEIWDYTPEKYIQNSPIVVDEKIYIGLGNIDGGGVVCLNAENGNEYTGFKTPEMGVVGATLAAADGKLFVGAGNLYCFSEIENQPPIANNDKITVYMDSIDNQVDVLDNDNDPDGDSLIIISLADPSHGTIFHDGTYVYYTPNQGYIGDDSFLYNISDGKGGTDTAKVDVTVIESEPLIRIRTGLFSIAKVRVKIINNMDYDLSDINWNISVKGGLLNRVNIYKNGVISILKADRSKRLSTWFIGSRIVRNFGRIDVEINVKVDDKEYKTEKTGFVIGRFVIVI